MSGSYEARAVADAIARSSRVLPESVASVRLGEITGNVDLAGRTVSVAIGGSTVDIDDVEVVTGFPVVGDRVWLVRFGTDLLAFAVDPPDDSLWLPAGAFSVESGAPTLGTVGRSQAWIMPDASLTAVSTSVIFPRGWRTYDVRLWHSFTSSGSGNVEIGFRATDLVDGADLTLSDTSVDSTVAVGTIDEGTSTIHNVGVTVTEVARSIIRVVRLGADGNDTFGSDWGLIAVELVRAT